jgi:ribonucleotide reductase alpha subunit
VQEPQNNDAVIMDNYKKLIESEAKPQDVFAFLDENAKALSKESTAIIVNDLEKLQNEYLLKLEEKYYENTEIQAALSKIYLAKKDMNDPNNLGTEALKNLINETIKGGYKVETAEGMFFPIVNYSVYKRYSAFLPEDFNAYIELMSVESDKVPAKDAALVIGWDELLQRALKQEAFINKYSDSDKLSEVSKLYDKYKTFVFLGLNNTPLFAYEGNVMVENAKKVYADIDFTTNDSQLKKDLKKFMELLKASNYKLTPEIDKFRGEVIGV